MEDIDTLFNHKAPLNERLTAANNIIANYDLRFNANDLIKASKNWYHNVSAQSLMCLLLRTNLRMFYAVIYALLDNKIKINEWYRYLYFWNIPGNWALGYDWGHFSNPCTELHNSIVVDIYCALYDYYEFDITNLVLPGEDRSQIQRHIDSKVTHTKGAIKK